MPSVFRTSYPPALREAVGHAARLREVLKRLELDTDHYALVERAKELEVVVSASVAEWRSGRRDEGETHASVLSYVRHVHRIVSTALGVGRRLEGCKADHMDSAGTTTTTGLPVAIVGGAIEANQAHATDQVGWQDSPSVLALFHAELGSVDREARALSRIGRSYLGEDELRALGREGLLDAARTFDMNRGVPFAHWARLRIRGAMRNGARDARRRSRHAQAVAIAHADPTPPPSPEVLAGDAEERARLPALLDALPPTGRELLERHYRGGESLTQLAETMGLPLATASRVHARMLAALRRQLRPLEYSLTTGSADSRAAAPQLGCNTAGTHVASPRLAPQPKG
jgi:RNA polymerase sigma factor (sigma-70 family)